MCAFYGLIASVCVCVCVCARVRVNCEIIFTHFTAIVRSFGFVRSIS